ncbi:serine/threonine-protein kinase [Arthrobacter sp. CAN_A214]|uniref:Stk1 family PASTA domain-containing Ser/Thr kinase n=1 Tax=Arthrobacter sp. CAN_A214 TaxID=2787720 RepID=UPI0018CA8B38
MSAERILNGRYEVRELIGRGGMADVHLGRDLRLGRAVAIKILRKDLARDPLFQSRFRREAQAVAGLNCPTIVAVYDTGEEEVPDRPEHEVKVPFIVMEFVAGCTLRDIVRAGNLPQEDALEHLSGVLSALEYSHRAGIVHRDIKPANVMITPDGHVKVMDFGIARAMADSAATMTQTQAVIGTAQYLSPEQARGETVDARSDLYSAGCLLYELLTGRPPFTGDSPVSVAYQHVREKPRAASSVNPAVSPALDSVLTRALAKDRQERFQDAASFRTALEAAGRGVLLAPDAGERTQAMTILQPAVRAAPAAISRNTDTHTRSMTAVPRAGTSFGAHTAEQEQRIAPREDDGERRRRRSARAAWLTVFIAAVILVLATGFFFLNSLNPAPEASPLVEVPVVERLTEAQATDELSRAGLVPIFTERHNSDVEQGLVVSSDPDAGRRVDPDSRVTMVLSLGPANVEVPASIRGLTESSARTSLEDAGLRVGRVTEATSATVTAGRVVSSSPEAGQSVPAGGAVDLVLSNGRVTVPLLVDLPQAAATALLNDPDVMLPYRVDIVENSVVEPGIVTNQSAAARSEVPQGTEIVIQVAAPATEPVPPRSPTTTPTPTPTPSPSATPSSESTAETSPPATTTSPSPSSLPEGN